MSNRKSIVPPILLVSIACTAYGLYLYIREKRKKRALMEKLRSDADEMYKIEKYDAALSMYEKMDVAMNRPGTSENEEELVDIYDRMSKAYFVKGEYSKSREYANKTLSIKGLHKESFRRLAEMERIGEGMGGASGLVVLTAYVMILGRENAESPGPQIEKELERHRKVLEDKTKRTIRENRPLSALTSLTVPLIKLEEILCIFKDAFFEPSFGGGCEKVLSLAREGNLKGLISHLENTPWNDPVSLFIVGCIKYIREEYAASTDFLSRVKNEHAAILVRYIAAVGGARSDDPLPESSHPIVRVYVSQIELLQGNIGKHFAIVDRLEKEERVGIAFAIKAKTQIEMKYVEEAVKTIERGVKLFPEDVSVFSMYIEILSKVLEEKLFTEKVTEGAAKSAMCTALLRMEGSPAYTNSSRIPFFCYIGYHILGDTEKSVRHLSSALSIDCLNPSLLIQMGHIKGDLGEKEFEDCFLRAASLSPSEDVDNILRTMYVYKTLLAMRNTYPSAASLAYDEAS